VVFFVVYEGLIFQFYNDAGLVDWYEIRRVLSRLPPNYNRARMSSMRLLSEMRKYTFCHDESESRPSVYVFRSYYVLAV
jgi:hypothetical protein